MVVPSGIVVVVGTTVVSDRLEHEASASKNIGIRIITHFFIVGLLTTMFVGLCMNEIAAEKGLRSEIRQYDTPLKTS